MLELPFVVTPQIIKGRLIIFEPVVVVIYLQNAERPASSSQFRNHGILIVINQRIAGTWFRFGFSSQDPQNSGWWIVHVIVVIDTLWNNAIVMRRLVLVFFIVGSLSLSAVVSLSMTEVSLLSHMPLIFLTTGGASSLSTTLIFANVSDKLMESILLSLLLLLSCCFVDLLHACCIKRKGLPIQKNHYPEWHNCITCSCKPIAFLNRRRRRDQFVVDVLQVTYHVRIIGHGRMIRIAIGYFRHDMRNGSSLVVWRILCRVVMVVVIMMIMIVIGVLFLLIVMLAVPMMLINDDTPAKK